MMMSMGKRIWLNLKLIATEDTSPKKQAIRKIPFAARQEIAEQLKKMHKNGVIKPSESLWASPIVLVKKKMDH